MPAAAYSSSADLIEVDARADSRDQGAGLGGGFHVERDDDGVVHGLRSHIESNRFLRARQHAADAVARRRNSQPASLSGSEISRPPEVCGS